MSAREQAFTLVELLFCLAFCCFVLLRLTEPALSAQRERQAIEGLMREIQDAVSLARHVAIHENTITSICRSDDGLHCQGEWLAGYIVFTDANGNGVLDGNDRQLHRADASTLPGVLLFRAFGNRQTLQFDSRGLTRFQNGNFTYCPASGDPRLIRQLILSFSGRTRMAKDLDGDGVVENSQGEAVTCPG